MRNHIRRKHDPNRTKPSRRQELLVLDFLREQGIELEHDTRIYICDAKTGRVVSRSNKDEDGKVYNRPDFLLLTKHLDRIVIISVDEHEHNTENYTWECEIARMHKVIASLRIGKRYDPRPVVWIRFNPNAYKVNGRTQRTTMRKRYAALLEAIDTAPVGFNYMFYSTTNGKLAHMGAYIDSKLRESPDDENLKGFKRFADTCKIMGGRPPVSSV